MKLEKSITIIAIGDDNRIKWKPMLPLDKSYRKSHPNESEEYCVENGFFCLRDDIWSATFGEFQDRLSTTQQSKVFIDFSEISWIDPLPLLALATTIRGYIEDTQSDLTINIGQKPASNFQRGAFLRFIAEHHFLKLFCSDDAKYCGDQKFVFDDKTWNANTINELEKILTVLSYHLTYDDSVCLRAKIQKINEKSRSRKKEIVKEFLQEINDNTLIPLFEKRPDLLEHVIHKLQVILYELVDNAFLHSYSHKNEQINSNYFTIYIRIRKRSYDSKTIEIVENAIKQERTHCPTVKHCSITPQSDWLEIFYYDAGKGLLADLAKWQELAKQKQSKDRGEFEKQLLQIRPTTNKLHVISKSLFSCPISSFSRKDNTALTGLQHIGLTLANNLDFARILVEREWAGSPHPWKDIQSDGLVNIGKLDDWKDLPHTKGTAWHFCILLEAYDFILPAYWANATSTLIKKFINNPVSSQELAGYFIIDERNFDYKINKKSWPNKQTVNSAKLLWLPGDITKQHIKKFVTMFCGTPTQAPNNYINQWIIADLPALPSSIVAQIIQGEGIYGNNKIEIYIISQSWDCTCLVADPKNKNKLKFSKTKAQLFLKNNTVRIFRILRNIDSKIFWNGIPDDPIGCPVVNSDIPFVYEKVYWEGSDGIKATLSGYLDLLQALTFPARKAVCQRALLRAWHLFAPGAKCKAADTLLTGLLPEVSIVKPLGNNSSNKILHIGSVLVSGSTITLKRRRAEGSSLHLFRHGHVDSEDPAFLSWDTEPVALEWMSIPPKLQPLPLNKLPYQRIPGTPFVGRGGAKTIPIRRFARPKSNEKYFDPKLSFYGEPPQEMYNHFMLCGSLKIGHWKYGGHHDLFTLNLGRVYRLEHNSKGPLVDWLVKTFNSLKKACVLVYLSHPVTDTIIRDLQLKHPDCLPGQVIPVKFLGMYSQSSIRIPSLTYDRIRQILEEQTINNREVILFDDGTISGKVARELDQLIRNANTGKDKLTIHLITLVTRTGLPLYRRLINYTQSNRHHYWRWDVPALGNNRMCPLCSALGKATLLATSFPEGDARDHIKKWVTQWECRDVETEWESFGLNPISLPVPREITFGKEWIPEQDVISYKVKHSTTTSLAAMIIEIIRITSYKNVGLRLADKPEGDDVAIKDRDELIWNHASLEILIGQILLFFDDLDFDELNYRYERLFKLVVVNEIDSEIYSLARLTLLLTEPENTIFILNSSSDILSTYEIVSLDVLITLGDLLEKSKVLKPHLISKLLEEAIDEKIMRKNFDFAWYISAGIDKDPYYKQRNSLRMIVLLLGESLDTMHHAYLRDRTSNHNSANIILIIRDLKILIDSLSGIRKEMYLTTHHNSSEYYNTGILNIDELTDKINMYIDEFSKITTNVQNEKKKKIEELHQWLFSEKGVAVSFQNEFLARSDDIIQTLVKGITRDDWEKIINKKTEINPAISTRWRPDSSLIFPEIDICLEGTKFPIIVCPPIVRQFLRDRILNVIHSSEPVTENDDGVTDMHCTVTVKENNVIFLLKNFTDSDRKPGAGLINNIIEDFLQNNFVSYEIEEDNGKRLFISRIMIPTIEGIGDRNG
jgi:hypothetical protein